MHQEIATKRPSVRDLHFGLVLAASFLPSSSQAADGFEKVRCDQPIVPALLGAYSRRPEPIARIEARRKAIGLAHLGADIVDGTTNTINWRICGHTFVVLDVRNVVRDAVELPPHSREAPAFFAGSCEVGGRKIEGIFLGVFSTPSSAGARSLPVRVGWRVDPKAGRFVLLDAPAACATDGIDVQDALN